MYSFLTGLEYRKTLIRQIKTDVNMLRVAAF